MWWYLEESFNLGEHKLKRQYKIKIKEICIEIKECIQAWKGNWGQQNVNLSKILTIEMTRYKKWVGSQVTRLVITSKRRGVFITKELGFRGRVAPS